MSEHDTEYLIASLREIAQQLEYAKQHREAGATKAMAHERIARSLVQSLIRELSEG